MKEEPSAAENGEGTEGITEQGRRAALSGMVPVLIGFALWNLGNYAFFVIAGRATGPEGYSTLATLLALGLLVQVPAGAIQIGISRRIASLPPHSPEAAWLIRHAAVRCLAWGLALSVMAGGATWMVDSSFPRAAVVWTAVSILPIPVFTLATGFLQGHQRFGAFSGSLAMIGVPRPLALLACLPLTAAVTAAVAGSALAMLLAASTALWLAWPRGIPVANPPPHDLWRTFTHTITSLIAGLTGVGLLLNLDIIVARATQDARTAGLFGAVAVLAKATIVIPQAAVSVLLPRVNAAHEGDRHTGPLLVRGLAVTAITLAGLAVAAAAVGRPVVELVFGADYGDGARYLPPLIGITGLTGLILVLMNHQLARGADRYAWIVAGLGAIEGVLFLFFHSSITDLLIVEAAVGVAGLVFYEALHGRSEAGVSRTIRAMAAERRTSTNHQITH